MHDRATAGMLSIPEPAPPARTSETSMTRTAWLAMALVSPSLACACGSGSSSAPPTSAPASSETRPEDRTQAESADYEVHEWGLVRGDVSDTLQYGVRAPMVVMAIDKPVLYFHAPTAMTLRSVSVEARSGGTLLETWPVAHSGSTARWENVAIDPSGPCEPTRLPGRSEPPCVGLDVCESMTLGTVRVADADCVRVGSSMDRFLFYRGRASTFTPPLAFERIDANGTVRVTNEGDVVIPGVLVRIHTDGTVSTLSVAPPNPHQSIDVAAAFDVQAEDHRGAVDDLPLVAPTGPGRESLLESMRTIGLTVTESNAFMAAWEQALFAPAGIAMDELSVDGDPGPRDSFVYFLPAGAIDQFAHVELDPPPSRGFHRAIALWTTVRASGVSH
jgi:hypothetical protein